MMARQLMELTKARCKRAILARYNELYSWERAAASEGLSLLTLKLYRDSDEGKAYIAKVQEVVDNADLYGGIENS